MLKSFKFISDWWTATSITKEKTIYIDEFHFKNFSFTVQRKKQFVKELDGNECYWEIEAHGIDRSSGRSFVVNKNLETKRFSSSFTQWLEEDDEGPVHSDSLFGIMRRSINEYEEEYKQELKNLKNEIILTVKVRERVN